MQRKEKDELMGINDREIIDMDKILKIMNSYDTYRIGLVDEGEAYIVPLSFGYNNINRRHNFVFSQCKRRT